MTQKNRGDTGKRINITGDQQHMPLFKDWATFLQNGENKTELVSYLVNYYKRDDIPRLISVPL